MFWFPFILIVFKFTVVLIIYISILVVIIIFKLAQMKITQLIFALYK